jgi:hypothetical protein
MFTPINEPPLYGVFFNGGLTGTYEIICIKKSRYGNSLTKITPNYRIFIK